MSKHLLILLAFSFYSLVSHAEDPQNMTLDKVNARIQILEAEMIKAQGDRYREKHKAEYGDDEVTPMRIEAKKLEKQLLELRESYDMRVRVLDEKVRTSESTVSALHKEINELSQLLEAIQREIKLAKDKKDAGSEMAVVELQAESAQIESQIADKKVKVKEATQDVLSRKKEVMARDETARKMLDQITGLEAEYAAKFGQMNTKIDNTEAIKALDAQRQTLMSELQQLRERKKKLQDAAVDPR